MVDVPRFLADRQGRQFVGVTQAREPAFAPILARLSDPSWIARMEDAQRAGQPALSGVIADLEAIPDVDQYFRTHGVRQSERFRKAIGVAVRILMEDRGWSRTGVKGYLGRRARPLPAGPTGQPYNASGISKWFNRSEKYRKSPSAPGAASPGGRIEKAVTAEELGLPPGSLDERGRLREFSEAERAVRSARIVALFEELDKIGTPEERAETHDYLMAALAETRRAEGRVF